MFRLWAKAFKNGKMIWDYEVKDDRFETRTHKVLDAVDKVCQEFDLSTPIWLKKNVKDFQRCSKVKFRKDNFIDEIPFDYLEIHVIEEDFVYKS